MAARVKSWLTAWVTINRYWEWSPAEGKLDFFDSFASIPLVETDGASAVRLRFEGKPAAKWWKDWVIIRILKELPVALPEITKVERIENCVDA